MRRLMFVMLALLLFYGAAAEDGGELYVKKAELSEKFILGMDVSSILSLENSGVIYYDTEGTKKDLFAILSENGINYIRVRVWNDPFDPDGNAYGGGNNEIHASRAETAGGPIFTAGIYVQCEGPGAWGKIDDFKLNSKRVE